MSSLSFISNAVLPWDSLLLFFFLSSGFFYGVFLGRARLLALTASIYVGIAFVSTFSLPSWLPLRGIPAEYIRIGLFASSLCLAYIIFYASLLKGRRWGTEGWWQVFLASFLAAGLAISVIIRLLPPHIQREFSEIVHRAVISDTAYTVWLLLPLAGMYLASRRGE